MEASGVSEGAGRSHLGGSSLPKPPRSFDDRLNSVSVWHMRQQAPSLKQQPCLELTQLFGGFGRGLLHDILSDLHRPPRNPPLPPAAITLIAS